MANDSCVVGIDLGGTNLRMRLCSPEGNILEEQKEKLPSRESSFVLERICQTIMFFQEKHRFESPLVLSFAIAAMLDSSGTIVLNAPNLGWRDVSLVELIQQQLPISHQTYLYNDVNAAAYAEFSVRKKEGVSDLACVFVGSGVGCGLVLGGKLYAGSSKVAAEFGHMKAVPMNGRLCGCGSHGCIEAYAGGHHLSQLLQDAAKLHPESWLGKRASKRGRDQLDPSDLEKGLVVGDQVCIDIAEEAALFLGQGLANLVTLLNPSHLVLGGSVMLHCPLFQGYVVNILKSLSNPLALESLSIVVSVLGDDAGLLGATQLGMSKCKNRGKE